MKSWQINQSGDCGAVSVVYVALDLGEMGVPTNMATDEFSVFACDMWHANGTVNKACWYYLCNANSCLAGNLVPGCYNWCTDEACNTMNPALVNALSSYSSAVCQ